MRPAAGRMVDSGMRPVEPALRAAKVAPKAEMQEGAMPSL